MHWPDIFFKARKPRQDPGPPPPFKPAQESKPEPESPKPAPPEAQPVTPPTIKPLPAALGPKSRPASVPIKIGSVETSTRTLPAMHGVVLRPPTRPAAPAGGSPEAAPSGPTRPSEPIKNIEQLMAEADPVHTLRQTGSIRLLKRLSPEPAPAKELTETPIDPVPVKSQTSPASPGSPPSEPVAPTAPWTPPSFPPFQSAPAPVPLEIKKTDPASAPQVSALPTASTEIPEPEENDSPFILKPAVSLASIPKIIPPSAPAHPPLMPFGSIFRRKAKMTELARIVLPSRREESEPPPVPPEPSPTVVPPSFPVAGGAALGGKTEVAPSGEVAQVSSTPENKTVENKIEIPPPAEVRRIDPETPVITERPRSSSPQTFYAEENPFAPLPNSSAPPKVDPEVPQPASQETAPAFVPTSLAEEKPPIPVTSFPAAPKVDPEAHKPESSATPLPKVDPEAHKAAPEPATPLPVAELGVPSPAPEKREFHLANGERVAGIVLSETPEAVYIDHGTLGVLTIPRAQIAKRLVEIILINGDRIVGDIMAETADTLYVRHASLGMLTVPRAQRSTRVVEAILKDGDRILGEVLTETETFTVIRSATLGTITVPHSKVSMLNRKIEQIELKALPPPAPEIKDKL